MAEPAPRPYDSTRPAPPATVAHFEDLATQAHAAHLGMWIFLGSEALLFAGLFALYAGYRVHYPDAFARGVGGNARLLGSLNTLILLGSSFTAALAVHERRRGRPSRAAALLAATVVAGAGFLLVKGVEYARHFREGVFPGGPALNAVAGPPPAPGETIFHTLYFVTTGLHALHVIVGMLALAAIALRVARGRARPVAAHVVALGALYWHLVDVIWIFLWPLFYLTGRP